MTLVEEAIVTLCEADRSFEPGKLPVNAIIDAVCEVYKIHRQQLTSPRRQKFLIKPRFHATALILALRPDLTLSQIGSFLNRDHSTVIHSRDCWHDYTKSKAHYQRKAVNALIFEKYGVVIDDDQG